MRQSILTIAILTFFTSCKNRDINEGEAFRPRPIRDSFDNSHFTKVTVDGVEYIMMERDNNNPHEGFGFMAFRANKLLEKQDSAYAYLKTIQFYQSKIYASIFNISEEEAQEEFERTYKEFLSTETKKLNTLQQEGLINNSDSDN